MYITKMVNDKPCALKLTRGEVIDLMLLCGAHDGQKWNALHEKLYNQLKIFDSKHLKDIE